MFGIMNINTGKCWPSQGMWYKETLDQFTFQAKNHPHIAVPKDYINCRILKLQEDVGFYEVR